MPAYLSESINLLLRWLHVIAAIAWIGESFYFVALDRGLVPPKPGAPPGVAGESWSVHGGGFYLKQKFLVAPAQMPETLHWSKWKAYVTWLSGFALFGSLYLSQPQVFMVDPAVAKLPLPWASPLAVAFLVVGWLVYDGLCRLIGFRERLLGAVLALFALAVDVAATHLFAGRAAFLLTGAVLATIMAGNVFFVIIPGQKRMVAALSRGQAPDPVDGLRGKQRSVHNTYLTLPVVFTMISNHYAALYVHPQRWALLALWMLGGALIRQFFVLYHGGRKAWWLWLAGGVPIVAALAWMQPAPPPPVDAAALAAADRSGDFAKVREVVAERCSACHSSHPSLMSSAPNGLSFDDPVTIKRRSRIIYLQVVQLRNMPMANLTHMTDDERALIARWYQEQQPKHEH